MRIRLRVYGTVQGVGFRWFAQNAARAARLRGYIRNCPDGAVELEAEGTADELEQLRRTVEHGPRAATVERVDSLPPGDDPLENPFAIRR